MSRLRRFFAAVSRAGRTGVIPRRISLRKRKKGRVPSEPGFTTSAHLVPENEENRVPGEPGFSPRRIPPRESQKIAGRVKRGFQWEFIFVRHYVRMWFSRQPGSTRNATCRANRGCHFPVNRGFRLVASSKRVRVVCWGFIHLPGEPGSSASRPLAPPTGKVACRVNRGLQPRRRSRPAKLKTPLAAGAPRPAKTKTSRVPGEPGLSLPGEPGLSLPGEPGLSACRVSEDSLPRFHVPGEPGSSSRGLSPCKQKKSRAG